MKSFFRFVDEHTGLYYALCACTGLTLRYVMVGGDINQFLDPFHFFL